MADHDPPYPFAESQEVLETYERRQQSRPRTRITDKIAVLDPIPPELPGCADAAKLRNEASSQFGRDMNIVFNFAAGSIAPVPGGPSHAEKASSIRVSVHNFMADKVAQLAEGSSNLLEETNLTRADVHAACGLFPVLKGEKKCKHSGKRLARVIFDARQANAALLPLSVAFIIFTLATLLEAIAAFGGTGFAYSVDMRHYYYQWRICGELAKYFAIIVKSKAAFGDDKERIFLPRVLAMGYRDACAVAQGLTWGLVLFAFPDEDNLGVGPEIKTAQKVPQFVWLRREGRRVGAIFVLLDGVFVLTADKQLRDRWRQRIERNLKYFNVIIKEEATQTADSTAEGQGEVIEFAGVAIRFGGPAETRNVPEVRPTKADMTAPREMRTRREHGQFAGELMWILRVRQASAADFKSALDFARWLAKAPAKEANPNDRWDEELLPAREATLKELDRLKKVHFVSTYVHPRARPLNSYTRVIFAATDATPDRGGWIIFNQAQVKTNGLVAEGVLDYGSTRRLNTTAQVLSEAHAVCDLADAIEPGVPTLVLVAIDADPVTTSINKGYSISEGLSSCLEKTQQRGDLRFIGTRVAGLDNLSDIPSRSAAKKLHELIRQKDPDTMRRYESTWRALTELEQSLL
jgi:hypothetical protein